MIDQWKKQIGEDLKHHLSQLSADFRETLEYAVMPPGKLFRPLLVYSLAKDLGEVSQDHRLLACAIEFHHAYTLVHDDLPAMDDDNERRGKPSTHIKFNEWKAILAGDALLVESFNLLGKMQSNELRAILKLFGQHTGANGLILGQVIDMSAESETLEQIYRIHQLKTASLMQLALEGAAILSERSDIKDDMNKIGFLIGINFQLIDDLCELSETISGHELKANPFVNFGAKELMAKVEAQHKELHSLIKSYQLTHLEEYLKSYESKMRSFLDENHQMVTKQSALDKAAWSFL